MRTYFYFKDHDGWFRETYDLQGKVHWVHTNNIKQAYRTSSVWLINHLISKELAGYYYWVEERDCYQRLI